MVKLLGCDCVAFLVGWGRPNAPQVDENVVGFELDGPASDDGVSATGDGFMDVDPHGVVLMAVESS